MIEPKPRDCFGRCCGKDSDIAPMPAAAMPHTWSNVFDVRATPAGARSWGPGSSQIKTWACGTSSDAASPPPKSVAAAETRRLIATRGGAVLAILPEGADDDDILALLQDAHTRIQREIHARRARRVA